ncbi:MAG: hypothetical protein K9I59_09900 [Chlorobium sp.]|jgi:hypothetical protein|uniref:hypothetical protein n=1 Tax=Chlorobium sp. TaxID=1095 RepID=UPI001DA6F181|nr:hypothetical protein [Chlorobium sp.]MBN1278397.1 hypothetical protein [Chlorobiaceae bacterium]MCF8217129.1 hypothetical protein [Chlorobium sp.]MCF8271978.1 hypothetical protein [Chlorobium sp.]MCF8288347.1 hypothetical protein [Chlorobium sp.]MCF8291938.1 hypothetical protein [Chlorobium sp.]
MPEVFQYPTIYPSWWMDSYFTVTWVLGMLFLAAGWAFFFRYGKFSYGVDLGCLWKTTLLIILTTIALGGPNYYNTRFVGEHGQDGDSIKIDGEELRYMDRRGNEKKISIDDITAIYQEQITYNPPPKIYIVAGKGKEKDSLFVTRNLGGFETFLISLSTRTGIPVKRP